jgi:hypothetical protein
VQQFRADSDIDLCRNVLIAELALMACNMQFALPNRTTIPATREAGLVQIADALSEGGQSFPSRKGRVADHPGLVRKGFFAASVGLT